MVIDFLVIGGGILGVCIARELKARYPGAIIDVLEKEIECGRHASGRNSGVIHAGFYYSESSLKAKLTRVGNELLTAYCIERGLPLRRCGKLVIAQNESDVPFLDTLLERASQNGVQLVSVTEQEAHEIEPRVKAFGGRALFSPNTSSADPIATLQSLENDAVSAGVRFRRGVSFIDRVDQSEHHCQIRTSAGDFKARYVVNAAGLYADVVARKFGFSKNYRILPFKGLYLYSDEPPHSFRTNIYPVPDLRNPFLGVHFTVTIDGKAKIGPTAIPAFWREQYKGFENFSFSEVAEIGMRGISLLANAGFDFRGLAIEELKKYSRRRLVSLAQNLAEGVSVDQYPRWGPAGIRAQLLDIRTNKLEMDFVLEGDERSMHVLNAVSPGWTCSMSFSKYVCDVIAQKQTPTTEESMLPTV